MECVSCVPRVLFVLACTYTLWYVFVFLSAAAAEMNVDDEKFWDKWARKVGASAGDDQMEWELSDRRYLLSPLLFLAIIVTFLLILYLFLYSCLWHVYVYVYILTVISFLMSRCSGAAAAAAGGADNEPDVPMSSLPLSEDESERPGGQVNIVLTEIITKCQSCAHISLSLCLCLSVSVQLSNTARARLHAALLRFGYGNWSAIRQSGRIRLSEHAIRLRSLQHIAACLRQISEEQRMEFYEALLDYMADKVSLAATEEQATLRAEFDQDLLVLIGGGNCSVFVPIASPAEQDALRLVQRLIVLSGLPASEQ